MITKTLKHIALGISFTAAVAAPASAQSDAMRVSHGVYSSAGSCVGCDLSDRTLPKIVLRDGNFKGTMFNRSNLSGGMIYASDLSNTHFNRAFLVKVKGERVNMNEAKMADVTLVEAKFKSSVLSKSDMRRADMSRSEFSGTNFNGANLSRALASNANFTGSRFQKTDLQYANLSNAILDKGVFHGTQFFGANLQDASFADADLSGAFMSNAVGLKQAQLDKACGNEHTRLPVGLFVRYCPNSLTPNTPPRSHEGLSANQAGQAARIDRVIGRVEKLIRTTPASDQGRILELQRIHSDLTSVRRDIED